MYYIIITNLDEWGDPVVGKVYEETNYTKAIAQGVMAAFDNDMCTIETQFNLENYGSYSENRKTISICTVEY